MNNHWKEIKEDMRWVRDDNAVVRFDDRSPYPNPANPNSKMFTAFGPGDDHFNYLSKQNGRFRVPKRWKTPEAAMKAVDKEYPYKEKNEPRNT